MKASKDDIISQSISIIIVTILAISMIYPFINALAISLNDSNDTMAGGLSIWPRVPTLANYELVLNNPKIGPAYLITILRTVIGTALSILFTALLAYGLSKAQLRGRKFYMGLCVFTMYFFGGLIPLFIVFKVLGLINNFWVYILPGIVNVWNMIVFKSFFEAVPKSLEESAQMDGANYYQIFFRIIIPVSGPVFASLILFTAVGHWNNWFDGAVFVTNEKLIPLQTLLTNIINSNATSDALLNVIPDVARKIKNIDTKSITMATMMVATIPILLIYPFLQKYFAKGVMIGSIKE